MSTEERRAGVSLASIFALRMLGLFLILPVFAVHAKTFPGGNDLTLVGIALGAYGLTQAIFQIPYGMASDVFGRKRVIVLGLVLFAVGSVVAGVADDIYTVILGRVIQGAGAISAAVTALAADLTREQHRTKVMAMIGSSIGLVFAGSLVLAPLLYSWIGMAGIFYLTGALALAAIFVVRYVVPEPPAIDRSLGEPIGLKGVLADGQLLRLNFGIFTLHLAQMAMFVVIPIALVATGGLPLTQHWQIYLPVVLASFVIMVPAIIYAERRAKLKPVFLAAIVLLLAAEVGFALSRESLFALVGWLLAFFVAFNILEASLPSLVSRIAPPQAKGTALGIYNTMQAFGLFVGGWLGGVLAKHQGPTAVFLVGAALTALWLGAAMTMRAPPVVALREYSVRGSHDPDTLRRRLLELPGVREAVVEPDKRMAYLKVNLERWDEKRAQQLLAGEI